MKIDPELSRLVEGVTATRPRRVLNHILEHGHITTAELTSEYGYSHPPRAARDVREHGIPLETFRVRGPDGRSIAAYRLGDPATITAGRRGRRAFSKAFKAELVARQGQKCALCGWEFPAHALQIDHRVPFEVGGDVATGNDVDAHMLVCGSCNASKGWSCKHCPNWLSDKEAATCKSCMWGSPENYLHIATEQRRTLIVTWQDDGVRDFNDLQEAARAADLDVVDFARELLRDSIRPESSRH
jgi:hypothetical protein